MAKNRKRERLHRLVVQVPEDMLGAIDARTTKLVNRSDIVREILQRAIGGAIVNLAIAGAVAVNVFKGHVLAAIIDSDVIAETAGVSVGATDTTTIAADGGGVAIAITFGGKKGAISAAVGASVAVNDIENDVTAKVDPSTIDAHGDVAVSADSTSSKHRKE